MIILKEHDICKVSMKKLGLFENFFKIFGHFSSPGGQNLQCAKKIPHFGKKKFRKHRSSQRKILACVSSKHKNKETHAMIFVQCQLVQRKFFLSEIFFGLRSAKTAKSEPPEVDFIVNIFTINYFQKKFIGILEPQCHKLSKNIYIISWQ